MRVHLYAQCFNDEFMLPFFFRHYDAFVDRYIFFDDGSVDGTLSILSKHPNVEVSRFLRSDPNSFVLSEQALSNVCWKASRGKADWVIVTDVDEHLYHPSMVDYLDACKAKGITMIPALGFQMISERLPRSDETLCESCSIGAPWGQMMKASLFDPNAIEEINFSLGRHRAEPIGKVRVPQRDEVLLLHYKYLGMERTHARHQALKSGLGATDLRNNWGHKYSWPLEALKKDWNAVAAHATDVSKIRMNPSAGYPIKPWWDDYRLR